MNIRRAFSSVFAALAVLVGFAEPGAAQNYPEKSIRIVTITTAGSPADLAARLLGDKLSAAFRQPVVVESMVGAAGNLAAAHVARATPDGYTLLMSGDAAVTTMSHSTATFPTIRARTSRRSPKWSRHPTS